MVHRNRQIMMKIAGKILLLGLAVLGLIALVSVVFILGSLSGRETPFLETYGYFLSMLTLVFPVALYDQGLTLSLSLSHTRKVFLKNFILALVLFSAIIVLLQAAFGITEFKAGDLAFGLFSGIALVLLVSGLWALFRHYGGISWLVFLVPPVAGIIYFAYQFSKLIQGGVPISPEMVETVFNPEFFLSMKITLITVPGLVGIFLLLFFTLRSEKMPAIRG